MFIISCAPPRHLENPGAATAFWMGLMFNYLEIL